MLSLALFVFLFIHYETFKLEMGKRIKLIILFFPLILISSAEIVFSQLVIDKSKMQEKISPLQTITGKITVYNSSSQALPIRVYLEDFIYLPPFDGRKKFLPVGTTEFSCGKWISFYPQRFVLRPFTQKTVFYTIKVPSQIRGGYYGILFFETTLGKMRSEVGKLKVVQRIGVLFSLESKSAIKKAEIEDIVVEDKTLKGKMINSGEVILVPEGVYYMMNEEGIAVDRGKVPSKYIPPREVAEFSITPSSSLPRGRYTMVLTFDLKEGDVLVKEIDFFKDTQGKIEIIEIRD